MPLPEAFPRKSSWLLNLRGVSLGLLASLVVLTAAAWALTLYQTFSMDMPMGIAVRGGMEGMAMAGIGADSWSLAGAAVFVVTVLQISWGNCQLALWRWKPAAGRIISAVYSARLAIRSG